MRDQADGWYLIAVMGILLILATAVVLLAVYKAGKSNLEKEESCGSE